jgi:hypothetical protein
VTVAFRELGFGKTRTQTKRAARTMNSSLCLFDNFTEWAEATEYCIELWTSGQMGKDYNRGQGRTINECIMGRVSQDCGGNGVDA